MKSLKIAYLWFPHFESTVIYYLIKLLSKKRIEFVSPCDSDLLIIGGFDQFSIKRQILNKTLKRYKFLNFFNNLDIYLFNRKIKPLRIFYPTEYMNYNLIKADYYISTHLGVQDSNHLRMPNWKDDIDWSCEDCPRDKNLRNSNAIRFGKFHNLDELTIPQGSDFLKKKGVCIFSSNLDNERKAIYDQFVRYVDIKGFGAFFNDKIKNHNSSNFYKIDIMKKFSINLCPENALHPGYYTEKVLDSFSGKCLPVTWADQNINFDFNKNSFINLSEYNFSNLKQIIDLLNDKHYLKQYSWEPLLKTRPNLEKEKKFINMILSNL